MERMAFNTDQSLLVSKIQKPILTPELVSRTDLLQKLERLFDPKIKVLLVQAPPGFGKTTLLSDWANQQKRKIAWYSVEITENNPVLFWQYFIAALDTIFPGIKNHFSLGRVKSSENNIHKLLIDLINNLNNSVDLLFIVLDDLQAITNTEILNELGFLIEHLPENLKLILSSQQKLQLPLLKMKANGSLVEIHSSELGFSEDETAQLLKKLNFPAIREEDIRILVARTEGWIFGIQLAALASAENDNPFPFDTNIQNVYDFLVSEVLDHLPEKSRRFLLEISVLDRFTADLCNYITDQDNGKKPLYLLGKHNLYLIPLDDRKEWFRFHQSFLDLLRKQSARLPEEHKKTLHLKASQWFEKKEVISAAFNHALLAGAYDRAVSLVENNLFKMLDHNELIHQSELVGKLPIDIIHKRPELAIAYTWLLAYTGQCDEAEKHLSAARSMITAVAEKTTQRALEGKALAATAYIGWLRGQNEVMIKNAFQALIYLDPRDRMNRSITLVSLGFALEDNSQMSEALEVYTEAIETCDLNLCPHIFIMASAAKLRLLVFLGHFDEAHAFGLKTILQVGEQNIEKTDHFSPLGNIYAHIAEIYRIRNDLSKALEYAVEGVHLGEQWQQADTMITTKSIQAAILWTSGHRDTAIHIFNEIEKQAVKVSSWYLKYLNYYMILVGVEPQYIRNLDRWMDIDQQIPAEEYTRHDLMAVRARVRILCLKKHFKEAFHWLSVIYDDVEKTGSRLIITDLQVMRAICYYYLNEVEKAKQTIIPALEKIKSDQSYAIILDKASLVTEMLDTLDFDPRLQEFTRLLLSLLKENEESRKRHVFEKKEVQDQFKLSSRENEILRYLATYMSSSEIAQALTISANTVRFHVKSIYNKLDVHSRSEAVELARNANLID